MTDVNWSFVSKIITFFLLLLLIINEARTSYKLTPSIFHSYFTFMIVFILIKDSERERLCFWSLGIVSMRFKSHTLCPSFIHTTPIRHCNCFTAYLYFIMLLLDTLLLCLLLHLLLLLRQWIVYRQLLQ